VDDVVGERSPHDPRPALAGKVGETKRVVADDGSVEVWKIVEIEDMAAIRKRIAHLKREVAVVDEWDEDDYALAVIEMERETRAEQKKRMEEEIAQLEEALD